MAIIKVVEERYYDLNSLYNVIKYVTNPCKTNGCIGAIGVNPYDEQIMIEQMLIVKQAFKKQVE